FWLIYIILNSNYDKNYAIADFCHSSLLRTNFNMSNFCKDFKEINIKDITIAGGKGANLGEMIKIRIPVPPGFVILAKAFERFLEDTDINVEINRMWHKLNIEDIESVEENSEILRDLILKAKMPKDIEKEILEAFKKLKAKYVAVRSSATAEDSKIDSWAGQLEAYLNTTRENLIENIKKCWASLYSPRALFYRVKRNLQQKQILVAVIIQKMIQSEVSGVCFTCHPVTKDENQMVIEAVWGLGEILVSGQTTPDTYVIDKSKFKIQKSKFILDKNVNPQEKMIVRNEMGNKILAVPKSKKEKQKLSENQIKELAKICVKIENHYKSPQDIEWALAKNKFYILQSRPITAL
ncbi:MAG: PEP/pyruvate-binding domain-containing protein, partial [Patescibacteria group bacterium]|nr:PEP/pyruvate-binding domain-containing protein [Patescibacteria group bacterium]